eukprot:Awhi_evm1s573
MTPTITAVHDSRFSRNQLQYSLPLLAPEKRLLSLPFMNVSLHSWWLNIDSLKWHILFLASKNDTADLFLSNVFKLHGCPSAIVSDKSAVSSAEHSLRQGIKCAILESRHFTTRSVKPCDLGSP